MVTAVILFMLLPVMLLAVAVIGAWLEGRRSDYAFGIGRVLSNAFGAIGGAPLALVLASALLNAPVQLIVPMMVGATGQPVDTAGLATSLAPFGVLWLLVYPFVTLFMTGVALDTLGGRPVDVGATLRMALRRMLPALGMLILFAIALMAGFLFLIVPGILLMLTWFVVLPVMAGEGRGIFDCFARSGELLKGMRWRLLLLLIVVAVLWLIASAVAQAIGLAIGGTDNLWALGVVQAIFATLTGMLPATGTAAVYHEARIAKEGMGSHDLEAVFA